MSKPPKHPRILAIAGSDSSGGAGIQADIKTITMLSGYAMTAITAVTAQNTQGVQAVETLPTPFVIEQIKSCLNDIDADAIKIGMVGGAETALAIERALVDATENIVFDPVMVATSGAVLADDETRAAFGRLMSFATVVTPNLPELAALTQMPCDTEKGIAAAAALLQERFGCAVLAKGGHAEGDTVTDYLFESTLEPAVFTDPRIDTRHTHGTGCTLSSAIATLLGHGLILSDAVRLARQFVREAIENAPGFGEGCGPLGHQAVRNLN
ncbi:MAG: bifunctional hydroxymethylpyrimidine kinase/phosphomethylpyrimidine kinase [Pseudomonadota bacterium]